MTLTITLPAELEQRLKEQSEKKHLSVSEYAVQLLDQNSTISVKNQQAIALLQSWIDAPEEESTEYEPEVQNHFPVNAYSGNLPEQDGSISEKNKQAIALLQSWIDASEEEIAEQKETWEWLVQVLDEERHGYREYYPAELKGITW